MTGLAGAALGLSLWRRLWIYQAERFPLLRNGALILVFASAGVTLSARLGGRALPGFVAYAVAAVVAFLLFLQLRFCDEVKDADDDRRFRPERPVPRGLVDLRVLIRLGIAAAAVQAALAWALDVRLLLLLAVVWAWMALMAVEFFVPRWLRGRPLMYLVSHMLVMPLIDLFITGCDWLTAGGQISGGLAPFLLLSFANGCVLEIGRKTWAPESERVGVESYSALWGARRAVSVWVGTLLTALILAIWTGFAQQEAGWVAVGALLAALPGALAALQFASAPTKAAQRALDRASGLWTLGSYLSVGFLPWL